MGTAGTKARQGQQEGAPHPSWVLLPGAAAVPTAGVPVPPQAAEAGHMHSPTLPLPLALHKGLRAVMFYSPHTPLLKCKKRKKKISTGCCSL